MADVRSGKVRSVEEEFQDWASAWKSEFYEAGRINHRKIPDPDKARA